MVRGLFFFLFHAHLEDQDENLPWGLRKGGDWVYSDWIYGTAGGFLTPRVCIIAGLRGRFNTTSSEAGEERPGHAVRFCDV